jgi:hypothetical protein
VESRIPVVVGTIFMWAQSFAIFQLNTQTRHESSAYDPENPKDMKKRRIMN